MSDERDDIPDSLKLAFGNYYTANMRFLVLKRRGVADDLLAAAERDRDRARDIFDKLMQRADIKNTPPELGP